jgi:hypothetical protein
LPQPPFLEVPKYSPERRDHHASIPRVKQGRPNVYVTAFEEGAEGTGGENADDHREPQ